MPSGTQGSLWPGMLPGDLAEDRADGIRHGDQKHAERKREARAKARDVVIPDVVDPVRREACRLDLLRFIETYLKPAFGKPWGVPHLRMIARLQDCILHGKKYCLAAPRGTGKSSIVAAAVLWAILYGHRRFLAILCDTYDNSKLRINSIRIWVEMNDLLFQDFPGPCACVRALCGVWNRANAQTVAGERTHIKWGEGVTMLAFPTIYGEPSSGARVAVRSTEKSVRGIYDTLPTSEIIRPDMLLIDDPIKTDEAHSEAIVAKIEGKILSDAMNSGGPGVALAAFMLVTVIADDDLASHFLDHSKHPDWQGERYAFFDSFPTDMDAWEAYNDLREKSLELHGDARLANEFYAANRAALDAGAVATWEARYTPDAGELSAVQHGMNLYFELGADIFMAEYQNDPPNLDDDALLVLAASVVEASDSGIARGVVPPTALALASGWDVGKFGIHWVVAAASPGRVIAVVDYGVQGIDAPVGKIDPDDRVRMQALELAIADGLRRLAEKIAEPWPDEAGQPHHVMLTTVDRGWMPHVVDAFCDGAGNRFESIHGCGSAAGQPNYYVPRGALVTKDASVYRKREADRRLHYYGHADALKQTVHMGFLLQWGDAGSAALFTPPHRKTHHSFARHLTAELPINVGGAVKWQKARGRADNHYLDAAALTMAAFSILEHTIPGIGITALGAEPPADPAGFRRRAVRLVHSTAI